MAKLVAGGFRFYDSLLEQGERLVEAPSKLIGVAQKRLGIRGPVDNGPGSRHIKSPFEQGDGVIEVSLAGAEHAEANIRPNEAIRPIARGRVAYHLLSERQSFGK